MKPESALLIFGLFALFGAAVVNSAPSYINEGGYGNQMPNHQGNAYSNAYPMSPANTGLGMAMPSSSAIAPNNGINPLGTGVGAGSITNGVGFENYLSNGNTNYELLANAYNAGLHNGYNAGLTNGATIAGAGASVYNGHVLGTAMNPVQQQTVPVVGNPMLRTGTIG